MTPAVRAVNDEISQELERIAVWIRTPGNIDYNDAIDQCARVLENRARQLAAAPADPTPQEPQE